MNCKLHWLSNAWFGCFRHYFKARRTSWHNWDPCRFFWKALYVLTLCGCWYVLAILYRYGSDAMHYLCFLLLRSSYRFRRNFDERKSLSSEFLEDYAHIRRIRRITVPSELIHPPTCHGLVTSLSICAVKFGFLIYGYTYISVSHARSSFHVMVKKSVSTKEKRR